MERVIRMFYRVNVCEKKKQTNNFKTKGNLTNQKRGRFIFLSFSFVLNAGSIFRKQKKEGNTTIRKLHRVSEQRIC